MFHSGHFLSSASPTFSVDLNIRSSRRHEKLSSICLYNLKKSKLTVLILSKSFYLFFNPLIVLHIIFCFAPATFSLARSFLSGALYLIIQLPCGILFLSSWFLLHDVDIVSKFLSDLLILVVKCFYIPSGKAKYMSLFQNCSPFSLVELC